MLGIIYLLLAGMLGCEASKMLTGEGRSVSGINRIWLMLPASFVFPYTDQYNNNCSTCHPDNISIQKWIFSFSHNTEKPGNNIYHPGQ